MGAGSLRWLGLGLGVTGYVHAQVHVHRNEYDASRPPGADRGCASMGTQQPVVLPVSPGRPICR